MQPHAQGIESAFASHSVKKNVFVHASVLRVLGVLVLGWCLCSDQDGWPDNILGFTVKPDDKTLEEWARVFWETTGSDGWTPLSSVAVKWMHEPTEIFYYKCGDMAIVNIRRRVWWDVQAVDVAEGLRCYYDSKETLFCVPSVSLSVSQFIILFGRDPRKHF